METTPNDPRVSLDPASVDELFRRDPRTWSPSELRAVVQALQDQRRAFQQIELEATKTGKRVQSSKAKLGGTAPVQISLDDLDLKL